MSIQDLKDVAARLNHAITMLDQQPAQASELSDDDARTACSAAQALAHDHEATLNAIRAALPAGDLPLDKQVKALVAELDQARITAAALAAVVGAETPIGSLTLAETWRAEKAGYMSQLSTVNHTLADMVNQYMSAREGYITHEFMSAQEDAIEYLEDIGWLHAGELERYYWTDAGMAATSDDTLPVFYPHLRRIEALTLALDATTQERDEARAALGELYHAQLPCGGDEAARRRAAEILARVSSSEQKEETR